MKRAPKGGLASEVNGQWYEGGEFTPDHGLFCGRGKNRVSLIAFEVLRHKVREAGRELVYREEFADFAVLFPGGNVQFRATNLKTLAKLYE